MNELTAAYLALQLLQARVASRVADPERGEVAEKVVIVGIFVAMAILAGLTILHAVTAKANDLARQINNAP
jgi:hypothetical protein